MKSLSVRRYPLELSVNKTDSLLYLDYQLSGSHFWNHACNIPQVQTELLTLPFHCKPSVCNLVLDEQMHILTLEAVKKSYVLIKTIMISD